MTEDQKPIVDDLAAGALPAENSAKDRPSDSTSAFVKTTADKQDKPFGSAQDRPSDSTQGKKPKKKKGFLRSFSNFLVYVVIIVGIVYGLPKFLVWKLKTNYPMAAITSGSMWPVLETGDLVFIKGVQDKSQVQLGDIIVFRNRTNSTLTIHRVVKLSDAKIITKGDANFTEDAPVEFGDVIGKTLTWRGGPVHIPYLGSVTVFASGLLKKQNGGNTGGKN